MKPTPLSSKAAGLIKSCEERLAQILPDLYTGSDFRYVKKILVPRFRVRFTELFTQLESLHGIEIGQFFAQGKADFLCRSIDQMLIEYTGELQIESKGQPLNESVLEIRQQIRERFSRDLQLSYESAVVNEDGNRHGPDARRIDAKTVLSAKGIHDRRDLFWVWGVKGFKTEDFGDFGKGKKFLGTALGCPIHDITMEQLKELADLCDLPEIGEPNLRLMKGALADQKIVSVRSMIAMGPTEFRDTQFPPFGTGGTLYSFYQGEATLKGLLVIDDLGELAHFLGLPEVADQDKNDWRKGLAKYGVKDLCALLDKGVDSFSSLEFDGIGKGKAFFSRILGYTVETVTVELLLEIGSYLELPRLCQDTCASIRYAFENQDIFSIPDLEARGLKSFEAMQFKSFGSGRRLFSYTHRVTHEAISMEKILALGRLVGLSEAPDARIREIQLDEYRNSLVAIGVRTKHDLLMMGPTKFSHEFVPPFGRGLDIARRVLSTYLHHIHFNDLHAVARILQLDEGKEASVEFVRGLLQNCGITDQHELLRRGSTSFSTQTFGSVGKGKALITFVFGEAPSVIKEETLKQLASWLNWE